MTDLTPTTRIGTPFCAVCQKPVEHFTAQYDAFFRQFVCIACCHGESEECNIPERLLKGAASVEAGVAFAKSRRLRKQS